MSLRRLIGGTWLLACLGTALAAPAARLDGFDLEQVDRLQDGVALRFSVFGSARSTVTLHIDGGRGDLVLEETAPGVYEGTYVLAAADRIRPESGVVATLRSGREVVRLPLGETLLLGREPPPWLADASPRAAPVAAAQAPPPVISPATSPVTSLAAPTPPPVTGRAPLEPASVAAAACDDCAVVESVRPVAVAPSGGLAGALTGTIAGSVLNRLLAHGPMREWRYDVVLRRPDGSTLQRRYEREPGFVVGERVDVGASTTPLARR